MRLLFKQRFFSWFDSYDIYDEEGRTVFTVQGKLAWGHCLEIHDGSGRHIGTVKEEVLTLFRPSFRLDLNGWRIQGNFLEWDYEIEDGAGRRVASLSKQLFNWTDTYVIDVEQEQDAVYALMVALAIDAAKCSQSN